MAKRKQVKNACVNCQRACKKCDDTRPCGRCMKYGIENTCVNSSRKERRRGFKRGPYRPNKASASVGSDDTSSDHSVDEYCKEDAVASSDYVPERPVRISSRNKKIDYREIPIDADETSSSSPDINKILSSVASKHRPLYNMVLSSLHGDLFIPPDQPTLKDLAALCSQLYEHEHGISVVTTFDNNARNIPTPPNTPVSLKTNSSNFKHHDISFLLSPRPELATFPPPTPWYLSQ